VICSGTARFVATTLANVAFTTLGFYVSIARKSMPGARLRCGRQN